MVLFYILITILSVALILLLAATIAANVLINLCFKRVNDDDRLKYLDDLEQSGVDTSSIKEGQAWLGSQDIEEHYIISRDGLRLYASFLRSKDENSKKLAVLVHGYQGSSDSFANVARFYYENGFSILFPDGRTHGKSEGEYITFGAFERYDVVDWVKYADNMLGGDCKILLSGVSMGTTTALLAAAEPDMPQLRYITADCGYTDPKGIFKDVLKSRYHLPSFPMMNIARGILKKKARFDYCSFSTLESVRKLKAPVTFIHGEADDFVNIKNTYENYEACNTEKVLISVPGAGHGTAYITDKIRIDAELQRIVSTYFN